MTTPSREGWLTCPVTDLKYGDHVRWAKNVRSRPVPTNFHVGLVRDLEPLGDDVHVTVRMPNGEHVLIVANTDKATFQRYVPWTEVA